jgi:hypothetical protein
VLSCHPTLQACFGRVRNLLTLNEQALKQKQHPLSSKRSEFSAKMEARINLCQVEQWSSAVEDGCLLVKGVASALPTGLSNYEQ